LNGAGEKNDLAAKRRKSFEEQRGSSLKTPLELKEIENGSLTE